MIPFRPYKFKWIIGMLHEYEVGGVSNFFAKDGWKEDAEVGNNVQLQH